MIEGVAARVNTETQPAHEGVMAAYKNVVGLDVAMNDRYATEFVVQVIEASSNADADGEA